VRWLARQIAGCFWFVAVLAGSAAQSPASACGLPEYRQAAALLADSSLRIDSSTDAAEQVLRACGDDPTAAYLLGIFPRFAEFSPGRTEEFRQSLSRAAERGVAAAAAIHGAWLVDTNSDRDQGARLITEAYAADDDWGIGLGIGILSGRGERLSDVAIARIDRLARDGFPLAYGILATQEMYRISDNRASYSLEEQTGALIKARGIAMKGMLRGDSIAVRAANRINKEFDAENSGLADLADALSAPDPIAFVSSHPNQMQYAHLAWRAIRVFEGTDEEALPLLRKSVTVCSGSIPSKWWEMCEVRAVVDHFVCMEPFRRYIDESAWMSSSAYRTCRLLRLRVYAAAPYY
jgi:hypothetical protein